MDHEATGAPRNAATMPTQDPLFNMVGGQEHHSMEVEAYHLYQNALPHHQIPENKISSSIYQHLRERGTFVHNFKHSQQLNSIKFYWASSRIRSLNCR